jgi:formylglycine-generating enzyme required for sulfatase activity
MYQQCVAAGACSPPESTSSETRESFYGDPAFDRYPVVWVDWYAADAYCKWAGGRLPSEAEWEKAGRGTDGRLFPWGDSLPDLSRANLNREVGDTTEVGAFPQGASPYGLLDVTGNVWEWVADWYWIDYDPALSGQMPPGDNPKRSLRGGSFGYTGAFASPGYRDWWEPYQTGSGVGFRCAVDVEQ